MQPRVCMVFEFLEKIGGMELQALRLAKKLHGLGITVLFLGGKEDEEATEVEDFGSCPVHTIRRMKFRNQAVETLVFYFFFLISLIRLRKRYDIIHAHFMTSVGVAACFVGWLLHKKVIVKITSGGTQGDIGLLKTSPLCKWRLKLLRYANHYIALTAEIKQELIDLGFEEKKILLISNGVDTDLFIPFKGDRVQNRKKLALPAYHKLVIYVGRLVEKKRVGFLLDAWQIVVQNLTDASLVIIGDGPLRNELQHKSRELQIDARVFFLGERSNVGDYLGISDLFVLPSVSEGMPNALLEAMACGLPTIATQTQGNEEVIIDGVNGLLFNQREYQDLADGILLLLRNQALSQSLGQKGATTVNQKFSLDDTALKYRQIYNTLVESKGDEICDSR